MVRYIGVCDASTMIATALQVYFIYYYYFFFLMKKVQTEKLPEKV